MKRHNALVVNARNCRLCAPFLPHEPNPIFNTAPSAKILIVGQAPGLKAHQRDTAFDDPSGDRLRDWMSISKETFYTPHLVSVMPMAFCFPGYKNGADAPPRKECAPAWHKQFLSFLQPKVTLYVGRYAQQYYLPQFRTLTEAVQKPSESHFVLPHPSGRNNRWLAKNPWFELDILPDLKRTIVSVLSV